MNSKDKFNLCTQDKITDYFELSQNKTMNTQIENTQDLNLIENVIKQRLDKNKSTDISEQSLLRTPRASSVPRVKRSLPSPQDAETSVQKIQKSVVSNEELLLAITGITTTISEIRETQQGVLKKLDKLDKIETSVASLTVKIEEVETSLNCRVSDLESKMIANKENIDELSQTLKATQIDFEKVKSSVNSPQNNEVTISHIQHIQSLIINQQKQLRTEEVRQKEYSQKHNLIFTGIREQRGEDCMRVIDSLIWNKLHLRGAIREIDIAHRMGPYQAGKNRPIIVRFKTHRAKEITYGRRTMLNMKGVSIYLHVSEDKKKHDRLLDKVVELAQKHDPHAKRTRDRIFYKGSPHDIASLKRTDLPMHNLHQTENESSIGFLGELSPLSNFYQHEMTIDGMQFRSMEHYYQQRKAETAGDMSTAAKISMCNHPSEAKRTAKEIRHSTGDIPARNIDKECEIMSKGLKVKFSDPTLKAFLLETKDKTLIECNPYDKIYGSGLALSASNFYMESQWLGENKLGYMLMELRSKLIE